MLCWVKKKKKKRRGWREAKGVQKKMNDDDSLSMWLRLGLLCLFFVLHMSIKGDNDKIKAERKLSGVKGRKKKKRKKKERKEVKGGKEMSWWKRKKKKKRREKGKKIR